MAGMKTDRVELVETQNIARALRRLGRLPGASSVGLPWERALYHALSINNLAGLNYDTLKKIREALGLP